MISLKKRSEGFTIIELLIVIIVIGILAALVITTYNGIQQKARNTERQTDINAIQGQLEAYFAQNGKYPALDQMNDAGTFTNWRETNMKGLDKEALKDPSNTSATPYVLATTPAADTYAYEPKATGGGACDNTATDCATYTLTATYEGDVNGASTYVKASLN